MGTAEQRFQGGGGVARWGPRAAGLRSVKPRSERRPRGEQRAPRAGSTFSPRQGLRVPERGRSAGSPRGRYRLRALGQLRARVRGPPETHSHGPRHTGDASGTPASARDPAFTTARAIEPPAPGTAEVGARSAGDLPRHGLGRDWRGPAPPTRRHWLGLRGPLETPATIGSRDPAPHASATARAGPARARCVCVCARAGEG